jgi:hypothetical protein
MRVYGQNRKDDNMTKSVTAYPNAAIDALAENSVTPHDIVCQLEEAFARNFIKPAPFIQLAPRVPLNELIANDPVMSSMADEMAKFAESRQLANAMWQQKLMIYRNFGRYGLEKDEIAIIDRAKEGLESVEDRLAAACYAVESVKSRKAWKAEQSKHQTPSNYANLAVAKKEKVGDRFQWVDSVIHELPPAVKGKAHAEAYYAMKLPDGRIVNLGASQGSLAPILNKYPSRALRNIATRIGIVPVGGDTAVLNQILEAPLIEWTNDKGEIEQCYKWLPSYTSAWQGNVWLVYIGWRLNPKCTPSSYWVDANNELTQDNPNKGIPEGHEAYQAPLSLSQLDYHLLSESSDLAIENENGEVVDFMNEEEEFLTCFPQREDDQVFIDLSKFAEDDDELELFRAVSSVIERSESGITMGDAQSKAFTEDYLHEGIESAKATIERCMKQEPNELSEQIIEWMQEKIERLTRLTTLHNAFCTESSSQDVSRYWYPQTHNMWTMGRTEKSVMEPVKTLPCMTIAPDNNIEPETTFIMSPSRYMNRKVISCTLNDAKQLRRRKAVENSITHNRFGMLIREKAAAKEFASTLDALLS